MLVIVDLFFKYCETSLRRQFAKRKCELVLQTRYPQTPFNRPGENVDGTAVRGLCSKLGIEKRHSSAYHPQGDGQAERTVENIKQSLRCLLAELGSEKSRSLLNNKDFCSEIFGINNSLKRISK